MAALIASGAFAVPSVASVQRSANSVPATHFPGDLFGDEIAISGSTLVIGAPGVANQAGAVYVFVRSQGTWHQQAEIADPHGKALDAFGSSVAVSGGLMLVGAPIVGNSVGLVYIFSRSGTSWHQQAVLADPGKAANDEFGLSVAVSGRTAVIGASRSAYIFTHTKTRWVRTAKFTRNSNGFGADVAILGTTIVIGDTGGPVTSSVYVYERSGSAWRRQARLLDPGRSWVDDFGVSVALVRAAHTLMAVVGADLEGGTGAVYVFRRSATAWHRLAKLTDGSKPGPNPDGFGTAVSISVTSSSTRILVGAPAYGLPGPQCGRVDEYVGRATRWHVKAVITEPRCARADLLGSSLALAGRQAVIGEPGKNKDAGAVLLTTLP